MPTKKEILAEVNKQLSQKKLPRITKVKVIGPFYPKHPNWPDKIVSTWFRSGKERQEVFFVYHRTARERNLTLVGSLRKSIELLCNYLHDQFQCELECWERLPIK